MHISVENQIANHIKETKRWKEEVEKLQRDSDVNILAETIKFTKNQGDEYNRIVPVTLAIAHKVPQNIIDGTQNKEEEGKTAFGSFGKNLANSLWKGFKSVPMVSMAFKIGQQILSAFRRATGSESPSKEFMKIGQDAMKGFAIGMGGSATSRNSSNINITY